MTNAERNLIFFASAILLVTSIAQWRTALRTREAVPMMRAAATAVSAAIMSGMHMSWFVNLRGSGAILVGMATLILILLVASFVMNRRTPAKV